LPSAGGGATFASLVFSSAELDWRTPVVWYDALIVAAAMEAGCKLLYSEDLQSGRRFGDLRIENPFA
jgi:predicted nucleic acid-binding protein